MLHIIKNGSERFAYTSDYSYNYNFNEVTGYFIRAGKTLAAKDDPIMAPVPEILDLEVTDVCFGPGGKENKPNVCKFCYKSNTPKGSNMSYETFRTIIDKMPWLTQIAFGADAQGTANPDLFSMMAYARSKGIIPNITIADISDKTANMLSRLCGAVAVSRYEDKNYCYNSIKRLVDYGLKQVNIHILASSQTYDQIMETFNDYLSGESRLKGLNAIVLLNLKRKGRGVGYTRMSDEQFNHIVTFALNNNIPLGFDSCGAHRFLNAIKNREDASHLETYVEPCESGLFSSYLNLKGEFFPCSFSENTSKWQTGLDVVNCNDFVKDIWNHPRTIEFRNMLLNNNRNCPIYKV